MATRLDENTGVRDEVRFVGPSDDRIITMLSNSAGVPIGAVLVCSGIGNDFMRTYRPDVLLGRSLAARGWSTLRFHYRGTGNSDGAAADLGFEAMVADACAAAGALQDSTETPLDTIVASRVGALVAAAAAGKLGVRRLVLVDPILDGRSYFREAWRAQKVQAIAKPNGSAPDPVGSLQRSGYTEIFGTTVHRGFYESVADRRIVAELDDGQLQILWVQLGDREPAPEQAATVDAMSEGGHVVTTVQIGQAQPWWLLLPRMTDPVIDALVATISTWIADAR